MMRLPGFSAESSLRRASTAYQWDPYAHETLPGAVVIARVECSTAAHLHGTATVEEYLGSYYVCCCPDDFRQPCECTGIV